MKSTLLGILVLLSSSVASAHQFGAIAYSATTGRWGIATDYYLGGAQVAAVSHCSVWDCQAVAWVTGGCAALAAGPGGHYGWAYASYLGTARANALLQCDARGYGCASLAHVCAW